MKMPDLNHRLYSGSKKTLASPYGVSRQAGQAMVESIIWGAVIMVFFFGLPMLGKYIDIRHKHMDATRYALWERTVWSPDQKTDEELNNEVNQRFMQHDGRQLLSSASAEYLESPEFSHRGLSLLDGGDKKQVMLAKFEYQSNSEEPSRVADYAYDGAGGIDSVLGLSGKSFELRGDGFTKLELSTNLLNRFDPETGEFDYAGNTFGSMTLTTSGAILSDSWAVGIDKSDLRNSVDNLVLRDMLEVAMTPGAILGKIGSLGGEGQPIIGEGYHANRIGETVSPDVLPDEYKKE